jgi:hypothetical protein
MKYLQQTIIATIMAEMPIMCKASRRDKSLPLRIVCGLGGQNVDQLDDLSIGAADFDKRVFHLFVKLIHGNADAGGLLP